jgi:AcrR family transcriptional regulator
MTAPRRYDSARRRAQAETTRTDVAQAARRIFAERGWAATTVRDIARDARVSEPTVYSAYGGKASLALALVDTIDTTGDVDQMLAEIEAAKGNPPAQLAALVAFDRRIFERDGDLIAMMRDAGRTEPELATAYREGRRRGRDNQRRMFARWPKSTLRRGLHVEGGCDTYAALCNIDAYRTLTEELTWSADEVQAWWTTSVGLLILRSG